MKLIFTTCLLCLYSLFSFSQNFVANEIEGRRLYQSEMASWYGTDVFLALKTDRSNVGGYVSYATGSGGTCVFFSKAEQPRIVASILFDSTYNVKTAVTKLEERDLTEQETGLYKMRKAVLKLIEKDTLFKFYKNMSFNLIPIVSEGEKKVYVLTGPQENGVVVFGNDYLVNFDDKDNITKKKQLHKNIIVMDANVKDSTGKQIVTMHTHLPETGDFFTATDICTLMLYGKFTTWSTHFVRSKNYVSFWNIKEEKSEMVKNEK